MDPPQLTTDRQCVCVTDQSRVEGMLVEMDDGPIRLGMGSSSKRHVLHKVVEFNQERHFESFVAVGFQVVYISSVFTF